MKPWLHQNITIPTWKMVLLTLLWTSTSIAWLAESSSGNAKSIMIYIAVAMMIFNCVFMIVAFATRDKATPTPHKGN